MSDETIVDQLRSIADELEGIEDSKDAYQRGYNIGLNEGLERWNWPLWAVHMSVTLASVAAAAFVIVGIWMFIHSAAAP